MSLITTDPAAPFSEHHPHQVETEPVTSWTQISLLMAGSFLGAAMLVPVARNVALHFGITDRPAPGKVHRATTPYLGGVAIVLVALGASPFLPGWTGKALVILAAGAVVAAVGLVDDIRTVHPAPRLLLECLAASAVFAAGARVQLVGGAGDWVLTVLWLVILTNAFNLLDNMDACAGLIATVTAVALAVAAGLEGQVMVGGMAALVAGSSAGFLLYNWHPARIFMGDAGSLFLGFMLATIALELQFSAPQGVSFLAVVFLAGPALFDTTLVVISRLRGGRPIYVGGTDHTSHRLLRLGLSAPAVSLVLAAGATVSTTLGVLVGRQVVRPELVLAPSVAVGLALLLMFHRIHADDTLGGHRGPAEAET